MKLKKFIAFLLFISLIAFSACSDDDDEPNDGQTQQDVEAAFKEMDETMGDMLEGSTAFSSVLALQFMEDTPIDLDLSNPLEMIAGLQGLFGTYTYVQTADSSYWEYSDQPTDEVILIYPVSGEQTSTIRLYNFTADQAGTEAAFSMSISLNGVPSFTATFSLMGSDLLNPLTEPIISSASITGTITTQAGVSYNFDLNLTNNNAQVTLGALGVTAVEITATGSNLIDPNMFGEGESNSQIDQITFTYRDNLQLVITDPEAESGDIGDVYYNNEKVGDLVVEEGEEGRLLIQYNDGTTQDLLSLMENISGLLTLTEGLLP